MAFGDACHSSGCAPIDDAVVRAAVVEARRINELKIPPPPLVDSPKCPGCSLVAIWLPDETNALLGGPGNSAKLRNPLIAGTFHRTGGSRSLEARPTGLGWHPEHIGGNR